MMRVATARGWCAVGCWYKNRFATTTAVLLRASDVALVAGQRIPTERATFAELAPDLAVEVLSPGDRAGEVFGKVADWLNAGTSLVWVIDPTRRCTRVYCANGTELMVHEDFALEGKATLPGFVMPLASLFV